MKRTIWKILALVFVLAFLLIGGFAYRTNMGVDRVLKYESMVKSQLDRYGLGKDTHLVLAIIYTETKGKSTDVMQASESTGQDANAIDNENDSISAGIANLVETLEYAQEKGVDVWTGVQAYNFGKSYVDYVADHGGRNTLDLAANYSREVVAPSLGNVDAETYDYRTFQSIFYNGGKLYKNGGNLFYAEDVKSNRVWIDIFTKI